MMKKIIGLFLLIMVLTICLVGCTRNSESTDDVLRVGIDLKFYPFMYLDDAGKPTGLEVDIAYAFGEFIGNDVEIVNTDFSMLIPALDTGDIDIIISDMSAKPDRLEKADFSEPYRYARTLVLVNKDFAIENEVSSAMSEEEFFEIDGIIFAGLSGTIATSIPREYGIDVMEFPEIAPALMEVSSGRADALIGANTIYGDHAANRETTIVYEGVSDVSGSSFAVKKGDSALLKQANDFIDTMYETGGFYDQADTKYDEAIKEFMQNDTLNLDYIIYPGDVE